MTSMYLSMFYSNKCRIHAWNNILVGLEFGIQKIRVMYGNIEMWE